MKKILAITLAAVMVLSLAACGGKKEEAAAATEAAVKTVQAGKLIMATNAAFPPYEFVSDEDGETIVGIDAEIAGMIASELGLELEIQDMEFASILTAVQTGKVDVGFAGLTVTEERLQNVNFTSTYAKGVQSIIVPEGSDIKSADDLAGHKIGVQESTTGHIYCEDDFGAENVTAYSNGAMAVQALLTGNVDCVVIDNEPAKSYVAANADQNLKVLDTAYAEENYAIAINKDNTALLDQINAALDELTKDGTIPGIIAKYIG